MGISNIWVFSQESNGTATSGTLEHLTHARSLGGSVTAFVGGDASAIAGITGNHQQYNQMQGAMNNGTGYPIPPSGTDGYGRPYWIDPQTGQMSYEPPSSGLGLGSAIQKGAAWAKWLM